MSVVGCGVFGVVIGFSFFSFVFACAATDSSINAIMRGVSLM